MKIHYFLNALGVGGTEKTAYLFAKYLGDGYDITTFTYKDADLTRFLDFQAVGNVVLLDRDNPDWSSVQECDILHVFRSGYAEAPEPGVHIEGPYFVETNIFGFIDANLRIDRTLFMSEWLQDYALRNTSIPQVFMDRFDFVNNPVEMPASSAVFSEIDCWPKDRIILGRVGRPDNGIYSDLNVRAAINLRDQGYDIGFIVVAAPSNMIQDLEYNDIPYFAVHPTVDPVILSKAYNSMDIYTHARADGETFGVNIAEAMIHRLPVITHWAEPSHPGMGVFQSQTTLVENGITGYVAVNRVESYTKLLKDMIDFPDTRRRMALEGFEKAMREYHVDACVDKLVKIYRGVVNA